MKRPIFIVALIQLIAAVISVWCAGRENNNSLFPVLVLLLTGIVLSVVLVIYVRRNNVSVLYMFIIIIYPITIIETIIISAGLNKEYGYRQFSGTVQRAVYKEDSLQLYVNHTSIAAMGIVVYTTPEKAEVCAGDRLLIAGDISVWDRARNPGNFDSNTYYVSCGYPYKCYADSVEITESNAESFIAHLYRLKQRFKSVYKAVYDDECDQLMNSIVLGDKYELEDAIKSLYQKSGMSHLLAISGLHISIAGMGAYRLLRKRFSLSCSAVAGIMVILSYLVFTGNSISAARAACMLVIAIAADVRAKTFDMLTALAAASFMQVLHNTYVVCNLSYIMSFLAMVGIVAVLPVIASPHKTLLFIHKKDKKKRSLKDELIYAAGDSLSGCIAIQLILLPVILYNSYEASFAGVLFNCIVIPLLPVVMISGIITGVTGLFSINAAVIMAGAAEYILKLYNGLCELAVKLPGSMYVTGRPAIWQVVLYAAAIMFAVIINSEQFKYVMEGYVKKSCVLTGDMPEKHLHKWMKEDGFNVIIAILIIIAAVNMRYVAPDGLYIIALDVGQGDCIYVRSAEGVSYLFDGGSTDVKKVGKYRIYPALRAMGITYIDYVVISHSDADHINGIKELIAMKNNTFDIGELVMPDIDNKEAVESYSGLVRLAQAADIPVSYCKAGDRLAGGTKQELDVLCLHPCESYAYEDTNDFSAIYRLAYGDFSMLMMGDAGNKAELCMLKDISDSNIADISHISVLKVGHHGSKYSCTDSFIRHIKPVAGVISCGVDNRYGHPHSETLHRLGDMGTDVARTDKHGAVIIQVYKGKMHIRFTI